MAATGSNDMGRGMAENIERFIRHAANNAPRSLQTAIGPSGIGEACERKLTYQIYDWPKPPTDDRDPIAAVIGTGFHSWMAEAFGANQDPARYKIEERVTVREGYTAHATISGSSDLYDRRTGTVWDWKLTGKSSLEKYRRNGPGDKYRIQAHLYGLGQENAGETPQHVAVCFVARHHELLVHVWTEPYDRQVALEALARLDRIQQQALDLDPEANPGNWARIPVAPKADCIFCPWLKAGSDDLSTGCPGAYADTGRDALQALVA